MIGMNENLIFDGPYEIKDSTAPWNDVVLDDFHITVYRDKYPVAPGHLLFVPKYNTISLLNTAFDDAFRYGQNKVNNGDWDGFNIGMNYNEAAGQTVPWPHIHLIPRYFGDVKDPTGGVRAVIPGQANYKSAEYQNPVK
jgi:diadenosine tetraphosphate (Ap4A) HIT family hydrolase